MSEIRKPPHWALRLLRKFASPDTLEEVEGDLEEFFIVWQKDTESERRAGNMSVP